MKELNLNKLVVYVYYVFACINKSFKKFNNKLSYLISIFFEMKFYGDKGLRLQNSPFFRLYKIYAKKLRGHNSKIKRYKLLRKRETISLIKEQKENSKNLTNIEKRAKTKAMKNLGKDQLAHQVMLNYENEKISFFVITTTERKELKFYWKNPQKGEEKIYYKANVILLNEEGIKTTDSLIILKNK